MSNLRKLMAVILSVAMMVSLFVAPAFAEQTMTDAEVVELLGVLTGSGEGVTPEYLASPVLRYQSARMFLRLKGLEDEALAFEGTANFADVEALEDWELAPENKKIFAYLYANSELGYVGYADGTARPLETVTAKEFYKVLLTALGYKQGEDFTWDNVLEFAEGLGLGAVADVEEFTVNHLSTAIVEALKTNVKDGDNTLIGQLVEDGAIDSQTAQDTGIYEPPVTTLQVDSVVATDLKTVTVNFNKEVDGDTIVAAGGDDDTVTVQINGADNVPDTVQLSEDKKSMLIVYTGQAAQSDKVKVTIDGIQSINPDTLTGFEWEERVYDQTDPAAMGVVALNSKQVKFFFTEAIDLAEGGAFLVRDDFFINGVAAIAAPVEVSLTDNYVVYQVSTNLPDVAFDVTIKDVTDFAGFPVAETDFEGLVVPVDNDAPQVVSAEVINVSTIDVTFDETCETGGQFKVDGNLIPGGNVAWSADNKTATLTLEPGNELDLGAIIEIKIEYKDQADFEGNTVDDWTMFTLAAEDDTSLPTVDISIDGDNNLTFEFSKSMQTDVGTITVDRGDDGTTVFDVNTLAFTDNDTKIEIAAGPAGLADKDPMDIEVKVEDMKDNTIRHNLLPDATETFTTVDKLAPTVANGEQFYKDGETAQIFFSEEMDPATLGDLGNYGYDSGDGIEPLSLLADAAVDSIAPDNKSVTLEIPGLVDGDVIRLYGAGVKDTAGNSLADAVDVDKMDDPELLITGVAAETKDTLTIDFSHDILSCEPSIMKIQQKNGADWDDYSNAVTATIDGNSVTFALTKDFPAGLDGNFRIEQYGYCDRVQNIFGDTFINDTTLEFDPALGADPEIIADGIAPTATVDQAVGQTIDISFDEDMMTQGVALGAVNAGQQVNLLEQFVVTVDGAAKDVYVNAVTDDTLQFGIVGGPLAGGEDVRVMYFASTTNPAWNLTDAAVTPNDLANFDQTVEAD